MSLPAFTDPVPDGGYRWWYLDAISDDGRHALTAIVFIGSVFSPWYAAARRRGPAPARDHSAINLALYGPCRRWCMTERGADSVRASSSELRIGPSRLTHAPLRLSLEVAEWTVPWPRALVGTLEVTLPDITSTPVRLDRAGHHQWQVIAPQAAIEVRLEQPRLRWRGRAYLDSNAGGVPLEDSFRSWTWSRRHGANGTTTIRYDILEREAAAEPSPLARSFELATGRLREIELVETSVRLPPTRWFRMPRPTRHASTARIDSLQTLEDAPFYARSRYREIDTCGVGEVIHESLLLDRFSHRAVQCLLPFRAPRRA